MTIREVERHGLDRDAGKLNQYLRPAFLDIDLNLLIFLGRMLSLPKKVRSSPGATCREPETPEPSSKSRIRPLGILAAFGAFPSLALAENDPKIDSGDTAWVLMSAGLVMLMTPGLALFYGGMVRRKNVLGTIIQSFIALGVVTVQWVLVGYSLAFGPDIGGIIGNLDWLGLRGVGLEPNPDYAGTIPHQAFMIFQMMFAVITPALITGAFAERFRFKAYIAFLVLWSTFVYCPLAHWVWGIGGWIRTMGALDFAGGLVVHLSSGVAVLQRLSSSENEKAMEPTICSLTTSR